MRSRIDRPARFLGDIVHTVRFDAAKANTNGPRIEPLDLADGRLDGRAAAYLKRKDRACPRSGQRPRVPPTAVEFLAE